MTHWYWAWLCDVFVNGILMDVIGAEVLNVLAWFDLPSWTSAIYIEKLLVLNVRNSWDRFEPNPQPEAKPPLPTWTCRGELHKCVYVVVSHWILVVFLVFYFCFYLYIDPLQQNLIDPVPFPGSSPVFTMSLHQVNPSTEEVRTLMSQSFPRGPHLDTAALGACQDGLRP